MARRKVAAKTIEAPERALVHSIAISARRRGPRSRSRYGDARGVRAPYGLATPPRSANVLPATVVITDPLDPDNHTLATVNRRVDILEIERSHKRISEAAYLVGRVIQAVFEKASGARTGGQGAGVRVDAATAHELAVIYAIDNAKAVQGLVARIERAIGTVGARFLRQVIAEGVSFGRYAELRGRSGRAGAATVAERFRWLLENVAEAWSAKGRSLLP